MSLNIEIIRTKYPKAFDKMKAWGKQQLIGTVGIPTDLADAIPDEMLLPSLVNSRSLYDFFDTYGINLIVDLNEGHWEYCIGEGGPVDDGKNRRDTEDRGFTYCFKELETKLT